MLSMGPLLSSCSKRLHLWVSTRVDHGLWHSKGSVEYSRFSASTASRFYQFYLVTRSCSYALHTTTNYDVNWILYKNTRKHTHTHAHADRRINKTQDGMHETLTYSTGLERKLTNGMDRRLLSTLDNSHQVKALQATCPQANRGWGYFTTKKTMYSKIHGLVANRNKMPTLHTTWGCTQKLSFCRKQHEYLRCKNIRIYLLTYVRQDRPGHTRTNRVKQIMSAENSGQKSNKDRTANTDLEKTLDDLVPRFASQQIYTLALGPDTKATWERTCIIFLQLDPSPVNE